MKVQTTICDCCGKPASRSVAGVSIYVNCHGVTAADICEDCFQRSDDKKSFSPPLQEVKKKAKKAS